MTNEKKAAVVFIVASRLKNRVTAVYDYGRSKYCTFSDHSIGNNLNIYDQERNSFIGGNLPNAYDYASSSYINIVIRNNYFSGYDYETSKYFSGNVYDTLVSLYLDGRIYNYSIS